MDWKNALSWGAKIGGAALTGPAGWAALGADVLGNLANKGGAGAGGGAGGGGTNWGVLGAAGINALGSGITGYQNTKQAEADRKEKARQFDQEMALNRAKYAQGDAQYADQSNMGRAKYTDERGLTAGKLQQQLNLSPLADKASYMLMQRLGVSPGAFKPRDYTSGAAPGSGAASGGYGDVLAADKAALAAYTPGAGGWKTDAVQDTYNRLRDPSTLPDAYNADALTKRFLPYLG